MEQSEEDQDPVLAGYMTFLKKALKTLPDGLRARVKARAGADVISPPTSTAEEEAAGTATATDAAAAAAAAASAEGKGVASVGASPTTVPTKALSAVAAAAGQLVGGMLGAGRALRGKGGDTLAGAGGVGGGRGLVRELVERCLFSLPHERGNVAASSSGGGDGDALCERETGDDGDDDYDDDDGVR